MSQVVYEELLDVSLASEVSHLPPRLLFDPI